MHIENKIEIDLQTLLPTKRQMVRVATFIVLPSLIGGLLLGLIVFNAPRGAIALSVANTFVAGGAAVFNAPGGALLALGAGLVWGVCFAFISAFLYTAWLIYQVTKGYNKLVMEQKMKAYCRAIAGKESD